MTIREEIQQELARLEALSRQKGVVTPALVRDVMPPHMREMASFHDFRLIAEAINAALAVPREVSHVVHYQEKES